MEAGRYPSRFMAPGRIPRLQTFRKMGFHAPKWSLHRGSRLVDNDPDRGGHGDRYARGPFYVSGRRGLSCLSGLRIVDGIA
jgi:hypothetical protein